MSNKVLRPEMALLACVLAGCQSSPVLNSQYISPRVEGCVLDAATRQPIANVNIRRLTPSHAEIANAPASGARALDQPPTIRTDREGRFDMDSERDLTLLRQSGWYGVTLAFTHKGYERFVTNYTLANAVVSPSGEPVVNAGSVLLQPVTHQVDAR